MLVDLILAGLQAVEMVLAVGVGRRRGDEVAVGVEQFDRHACEQDLRIVEIAVLVLVGVHATADRGRRLFAEVVLNAVLIGAEVDAGDELYIRRRRACAAERADALAAVEVSVGWCSRTRVRAGRRSVN